MNIRRTISILLFLSLVCGVTAARSEYLPSKAVYDVSTASPEELNRLLDRVSLLQIMYGNDPFDASIVLVVHEGAIPLFARADHKLAQLMQRAASLTAAEIIEFRLCGASARLQGFGDKDFHGFVTLIPMADAEIVQLQQDGYAYLR
jgi:intracellular sulfur oxidation DsrE/DsrF family protein